MLEGPMMNGVSYQHGIRAFGGVPYLKVSTLSYFMPIR